MKQAATAHGVCSDDNIIDRKPQTGFFCFPTQSLYIEWVPNCKHYEKKHSVQKSILQTLVHHPPYPEPKTWTERLFFKAVLQISVHRQVPDQTRRQGATAASSSTIS